MNRPITVFDRIVMESLIQKSKNIKELIWDTGLSEDIIRNILIDFQSSNFIDQIHDRYSLNVAQIRKQNDIDLKQEVFQLVYSMIQVSWKKEIKLKKVSLADEEHERLKGLLNQIEKLIEESNIKNSNTGRTCQKNIFFWCQAPYQEIINNSL